MESLTKGKFGSYFILSNRALRLKQKTFILLLIKCLQFSGTSVSIDVSVLFHEFGEFSMDTALNTFD